MGALLFKPPCSQQEGFFMTISKIVQQVCGKAIITIPIPLPLLEFVDGNYLAAALIVQIAYWSEIKKNATGNSWFYKTDEEWFEELRIKSKTLQRLRNELVGRGFINVKRKRLRNGITINHYKIAPEFNPAFEKFLSLNWTDCPVQQQPTGQNDQSSTGQIDQSIYTEITEHEISEEDLKKENHFLGDPENLKSIKTEAPYGGHKSSIGVESKPSLASQGDWGVNNNIEIEEDNHTLKNSENPLQEKQKRSGSSSPLASGADTAAAAAWIESLNQKTGSTYPAAAGFIKAYQKVQKQNNLTNEQLLAVIDNAIASGLSGTWLNPNHLLRHALDFAFAAPCQQTRSSIKRIAAKDLASRQGWVYIENPANNPNAKHINIESGFETGEIVNGQTVWYPDGSKSSIYM
jgi:hypothetical protein